jgi:predicted nuclease of predicted toxin-antitoxin system
MSRPRFFADHDLNEKIIEGVQQREPAIDFLHVRQIGYQQRSDDEILEYAASHGWIVTSHDANTMTAHAYARIDRSQPMAGLFIVHQNDPIGPVIEDLMLIWTASEAEDWWDRVEFLPL